MRSLALSAAMSAVACAGPIRADEIGARCGLGAVGFVSTRAGTVCLQANAASGANLTPAVSDTAPPASSPAITSAGVGGSSDGPRIGTTLHAP